MMRLSERFLVGVKIHPLVLAVFLSMGSTATVAQCLPMVQAEPRILPAALPAPGDVRLTYLGHSSFLIESSGGASAVTDYNGVHRAPFVPELDQRSGRAVKEVAHDPFHGQTQRRIAAENRSV
jgi:hypothetical protein